MFVCFVRFMPKCFGFFFYVPTLNDVFLKNFSPKYSLLEYINVICFDFVCCNLARVSC